MQIKFEAPRDKVTWAGFKIDDLKRCVEVYTNDNSCHWVEVLNSQLSPHGKHFVLKFEKSLPREIPFLMGDIVHNLRSSLDIAVCDVAVSRGLDRTFSFPFAQNKENLESSQSFQKLRSIGLDFQSAIMAIGPYFGGNNALKGLYDLDILDKHKTIIPVAAVAMDHELDFGVIQISLGGPIVYREGQIISSLGAIQSPPPLPDSVGCPILPAEAQPFSEVPIVPVVEYLKDMVSKIIDQFEHLVAPSR